MIDARFSSWFRGWTRRFYRLVCNISNLPHLGYRQNTPSALLFSLPTKRSSHTNTFFPSSRFIQLYIVIQFCLLLTEFRLIRVSLSSLYLQRQYLQLQFENFILDLSILHCSLISITDGRDCVVEPARTNFGLFSDFARVFEDFQVCC